MKKSECLNDGIIAKEQDSLNESGSKKDDSSVSNVLNQKPNLKQETITT